MAFKKKVEPAAVAPPADNPLITVLRAKRQIALKKIDAELAVARRAAQAASIELTRARRTLDLLSDNRNTVAETFDVLIMHERNNEIADES